MLVKIVCFSFLCPTFLFFILTGDDAQFEMDIWLSFEGSEEKQQHWYTCVPDLADRIIDAKRQKRQYQQSHVALLPLPPSPCAKGCKDELHLTISSPVSCSPSQLGNLDWRLLTYFCRTKQPTEENKFKLWFPSSTPFFFLIQISINLLITDWLGVWGSDTEVWWVQHHSLFLLSLLNCPAQVSVLQRA